MTALQCEGIRPIEDTFTVFNMHFFIIFLDTSLIFAHMSLLDSQ